MCFGIDGGAVQCPSPPRTIALRAGHLFDSNTGRLLDDQTIVIQGERIADVGPATRIKIPADAAIIDLGNATVLPGLIDAHTHMFDTPKPNTTRETATLIAIQHLQQDLQAGFTTIRDMSTHGNGYGDVDIRTAINAGRSPNARRDANS